MTYRGSVIVPRVLQVTDELQLRPILSNLFQRNVFPVDPNGIFMIITGFDVLPGQMTTSNEGYCSSFCMSPFVWNIWFLVLCHLYF
jgi:hypothetical protein